MPTNSSVTSPRRPRSSRRLAWYLVWAVVGAAGTVGLVSFGPILLAPAFIAGVVLTEGSDAARRSKPGLLVGAAAVFLYVAYLQRQGPGTTCWHTARAGGCDQHLNPIPWLVIGLLLFLGAMLIHRHARN